MSKSDGADCGEEDSFDNCCCCNDPGLGKCAGVLIGEIVSGKDFFNEIKKEKKKKKHSHQPATTAEIENVGTSEK